MRHIIVSAIDIFMKIGNLSLLRVPGLKSEVAELSFGELRLIYTTDQLFISDVEAASNT